MKTQAVVVLLCLLMATLVSAVDLPDIPSLHQQCNQNMVCAKGAYCRKSGDPVYGTCEDPKHT
ncbi:unnamed protein product [Mucor hiemalis]